MNDFFQPGQHPDADQLSAFAEQALPAYEKQQVLGHLAGCAACRGIVYLAQEAGFEENPETIIQAPDMARRPWFANWFTGWRLAWPFAAAVTCLIVLAIQSYHYSTHRSGDTTVTTATNASVPQIAPVIPQGAQQEQSLSKLNTPRPAPMKSSAPRQIDATTPAVSRTIPPEIVDSIPMNGRNAVALSRLEANASATGQASSVPKTNAAPNVSREADKKAGTGVGNGVAGGLSAAGGTAKPAASAAEPLEIKAAPENQLTVSSGQIASLDAVRGSARSIHASAAQERGVPGSLPSHLAAVSTVSKGSFTLAIDTAGALFATKDGGKHWKAISAPWAGRAVKVELASVPQQVTSAPRLQVRSEAKPAPEAARTASAKEAQAPAAAMPPADYGAGSGQVTGVVTDQTGAVIPGAGVTLVNPASGATRTDLSRQNGLYFFDDVEPGVYSLKATARGFQAWEQTGIAISPNAGASINIKLTVGAQTQTVTVSADALEVQTDSNAVSTLIDEDKITAWPEVFELTTENGAVWVSTDGRHWKRK